MIATTHLSATAISAVFVLCLCTSNANAAGQQKVGFNTADAAAGPSLLDRSMTLDGTEKGQYVFSAPPRESAETAEEIYGPIAEYLSKVTGKQVVFRYSSNWINYQSEMRKGEYDLVFDGPHLNAWRAAHLQHTILVKAPGNTTFVVAVKRNSSKLQDLKQLTGRAICGMSPPSLGTLTVLGQFDNPLRQPRIVSTRSWDDIYHDLLAGQCAAAILPTRNLAKYDPQGTATRVIFRAKTYPSQALSAGPRVSPEDQEKIVRAMTLPEARSTTARLRETNALSGDFLPVGKNDYAGVASILKDTWGYQ
jgi:ABC-type phosphate/phosphonate transport system substrate-binding protein